MSEEIPVAIGAIVERRRRRRGWWWVAGGALLVWGIVGLVLLGMFWNMLAAPITELDTITGSVESQRTAALEAIDSAKETIDQTAVAVRGMDTSLSDAKAATDRSSGIALDVATSMGGLANAMSISIFNLQPLIGLQPSFQQSADQLGLLATDLQTIGAALDSNRDDAKAVATSLDGLGDALDKLRTSVASTPHLDEAAKSLETVRMGMLALFAWLGVMCVGAIIGGLACWNVARGG